ncbi:MAG: (Fe-S)-binding protein, partial [Candidatus Delongbacteria bacterium]|nr:(Fe-S)-binding protein [Candidatus Delongbacteria bacterium]
MKLKNNSGIADLADKCTNCGNCRLICPVFKIKNEELYSTRGRINLIRGLMKNELEPNSDTVDKIYACLNCGQCSGFCPADVEYTLLIKKIKSNINISSKLFNPKNYVLGMLFSSKPEVSDAAFRIFRFLNRFFFRSKKLKFFRYMIFKLLKIPSASEFPELPDRNFFRMGNRTKITNYRGFRVALFLGCGGKYIYPQTADRFVRLLRTGGIQVLIPKEQVCSGSPLENRGMIKEASRNIKKNISVFNSMIDIRYITSICSNEEKSLRSGYSERSSDGFRLEYINWMKLILENDLVIKPAFNNSVIFHCCPKCETKDLAAEFTEKLYADHPYKPELVTDFCGATELFERSNQNIRDIVMKKFYDRNRLD